ncbi:nodulation protein NfeD [Shewanella cyperi]|uniref:Nodulation protein NfeD n=1 Tax=Shewanella cyperi TaxID=2814292 RepID=A0A975AL86_9GAMM|nr:nodulation protein NfeD [Shewanella cyperi]QSX30945.1 nodulation protein NfeD [Shewanella cyperi]
MFRRLQHPSASNQGLNCYPAGLLGLLLAVLLILPGPSYSEPQPQSLSQSQSPAPVLRLEVSGAIGPGVSDYLTRTMARAAEQTERPQLLLITLDTPGGLVSSLRDINQAILASPIPVACFVYPEGARAASAGTYMLYACHVAAMAPATSLGAATPVQLGPPGGQDQKESSEPSDMERKILNDAIAYIRTLAQLRGRNADWGEKAVREAATATASEALELGVIDLVAANPRALLDALDGRKFTLGAEVHTLNTRGAPLVDASPDWRAKFINTITNPNVAYVLMLLGVYGLLLEFYSPGFGVSGVVGAICLLLAMFALQMLPVSYAGGALLLLGIGLLVAESLVPSFGILGFGGIVAFVLGSIFLIDSEIDAFRIAWPVILTFTLASFVFFLVVLTFVLKNRRRAPVTGLEAMVGQQALVLGGFPGEGEVMFMGERWNGHSSVPLAPGDLVRVDGIEGLVLELSPMNKPKGEQNE